MDKGRAVSRKGRIYITCSAVLILAVAVFGYLYGKNSAVPLETQTFFAVIEEVGDTSMLVDGIEENDINHRGKYHFHIDSDVVLEWHYTKIALSDLEVGDRVSITYTGEVLESYPAQLKSVVKIQLLEEDK